MAKSNRHKKRRADRKRPPAVRQAPPGFRIVGIGGSAGGLEPFRTILRNLPARSTLAFVFVQHLDPAHASSLTQILSRETEMPVEEITDRMQVEPGRTYAMPANVDVTIRNNRFHVARRSITGVHLPVDTFFSSIAEQYGDCAVGVVLSGLGSDGTMGLQAIKAEGGITFAQEPTSAAFASCRPAPSQPELPISCCPLKRSPKHCQRSKRVLKGRPSTAGSGKERGPGRIRG
jgi:two-component system CheB/CheR fusion protein